MTPFSYTPRAAAILDQFCNAFVHRIPLALGQTENNKHRVILKRSLLLIPLSLP